MAVPKTLIQTGFFGGIISLLAGFAVDQNAAAYGGVLFGYILFLMDFLIIFVIFKNITSSIANGQVGRNSSMLVTITMAFVKIIAILGALYVGLAVYRLNVFFVFAGMLASVCLVGIWIAVTYFSGKSGFEI